MMHPLTLANLVSVLQATSHPPIPSDRADGCVIRQISTDSRSLGPGDLFVALRGDRFDGHDFVERARQQGAIAAMVDSQYQPSIDLLSQSDFILLQVPDTLVAYQQMGHFWRQQFQRPVVAITGSVGKTTTKELIAAVLETQGPVLKTQANYNNEIGVPKTLLELRDEHQFAVVEMGMRGRGEIELLSKIAEPDIAVITNVGTAHIERLGSEQAIAEAKCELFRHTRPDGVAILNYDNERLINTATQVWSGKILTFGLEGGDIHGTLLSDPKLSDPKTPMGSAGRLQVGEIGFDLPLPGRHNALNFLAALAVAQVLGIDWQNLRQLKLTLPGGRAQRYDLARDVVILDETYNAGLESMQAALQLLADTPGQRRIAVLGTMKELGDRSLEFHQQVGERAAALKLDGLMILADPAEATALAQGAGSIPTQIFNAADPLVTQLVEQVQPGDRLLFKASRAVALDQVVARFRTAWDAG